ncbi:hypothetical protein ACJX0J_021936, partial [Zea mays]
MGLIGFVPSFIFVLWHLRLKTPWQWSLQPAMNAFWQGLFKLSGTEVLHFFTLYMRGLGGIIGRPT